MADVAPDRQRTAWRDTELMSPRRWAGLVFAVALASGAALAFAPTVSTESCVAGAGGAGVCTSGSAALFDQEGSGVLAVLAVPALVAVVPVVAPSRQTARWAAIALTGAAGLAIASVGVFFLPTVALAWVASRQALRTL